MSFAEAVVSVVLTSLDPQRTEGSSSLCQCSWDDLVVSGLRVAADDLNVCLDLPIPELTEKFYLYLGRIRRCNTRSHAA